MKLSEMKVRELYVGMHCKTENGNEGKIDFIVYDNCVNEPFFTVEWLDGSHSPPIYHKKSDFLLAIPN